jgi:hypothetical protein
MSATRLQTIAPNQANLMNAGFPVLIQAATEFASAQRIDAIQRLSEKSPEPLTVTSVGRLEGDNLRSLNLHQGCRSEIQPLSGLTTADFPVGTFPRPSLSQAVSFETGNRDASRFCPSSS